jgi:hypothetical protein
MCTLVPDDPASRITAYRHVPIKALVENHHQAWQLLEIVGTGERKLLKYYSKEGEEK